MTRVLSGGEGMRILLYMNMCNYRFRFKVFSTFNFYFVNIVQSRTINEHRHMQLSKVKAKTIIFQ